ncbi:unnamed protein product, partial [Polarella glacialis]
VSQLATTTKSPGKRRRLCGGAAEEPQPRIPPDDLDRRLYGFWDFIGNCLLGASSQDSVCSLFELGGSIDCIGDVAFTRDEITAPFLRVGDLPSVVWHCLLICWLGAGGPNQETYRWLRAEKLI